MTTEARAAYTDLRDVKLADTRAWRAEDWFIAGYRAGTEPDEAAREAIIERMAEAILDFVTNNGGRDEVEWDELARAAYEASRQ